MDQYDFEQCLKSIEQHVNNNGAQALHQLNNWHKRFIKYRQSRVLVERLMTRPDWNNFNPTIILDMANEIDAPFVTLMLRLTKEHINYSAVQMHMWWRRIKSIGQQNILSYLNINTLLPFSYITYTNIIDSCRLTKDALTFLHTALKSDSSVDLALRNCLDGISMQADVHKAWRDWAKTHHPDKGGDINRFVIAKACYEEWCTIYGESK